VRQLTTRMWRNGGRKSGPTRADLKPTPAGGYSSQVTPAEFAEKESASRGREAGSPSCLVKSDCRERAEYRRTCKVGRIAAARTDHRERPGAHRRQKGGGEQEGVPEATGNRRHEGVAGGGGQQAGHTVRPDHRSAMFRRKRRPAVEIEANRKVREVDAQRTNGREEPAVSFSQRTTKPGRDSLGWNDRRDRVSMECAIDCRDRERDLPRRRVEWEVREERGQHQGVPET